ncbi:DUF899 family protein [Steroidobacter agaridevorans]|uniref:DUF899 family protein n=1 Tax=Steroidobacter agaridevorans TaxID=2695856 RepID=UPI001321853B|nr:DUF899 family protein [Steroidobacter agaridevorans]GFE85133.1 hypothetical protein GCM10011488_00870 [Steroidobacter agaridevorans]
MAISFPNESTEYRTARNALLEQEIALRRQMEAVAVQRRALPAGGKVPEDYEFDGLGADGKATKIKLSALFRDGTDSLVIYNYMFPRHQGDTRAAAASGVTSQLPKTAQPCPSCTALIDQLDAAAQHFEAGGGNFAVVAKAPLDQLLGVARDRGWRHVRLLSSAGCPNFRRDYRGEDEEGQQVPLVLVFKRARDGAIRFFWASELMFAPPDSGQDQRAAGTLEPFWNLFDLTPGGRPDFAEELQYE